MYNQVVGYIYTIIIALHKTAVMKAIKRLIVFFIGVSIPTTLVILVWLVTFMSFELKDVLHSVVFQVMCTLWSLVWSIAVVFIPYEDIEDMVS